MNVVNVLPVPLSRRLQSVAAGRLRGLGLLLCTWLLFAVGGCSPTASPSQPAPDLVTGEPPVELSLSPSSPTLPFDTPLRFTASGHYADGSRRDISALAEWAVTDAQGQAVAPAPAGLLAGAPAGQYTVTVRFGGRQVSTHMLITAATLTSLALTPKNPTIAKGTMQTFTATGTFSDGSTQDLTAASTWSITSLIGSGVAVLDSVGVVQGTNPGAVTITAKHKGFSDSTTLQVTPAFLTSLSVTPTSPILTRGSSLQLRATASFSDGTTQDISNAVSWSVTDVSGSRVAAIDSSGMVFARSLGKATVAAEYLSESTSVTLEVRTAMMTDLVVQPGTSTLIIGGTQQYQAFARFSDGSQQDVTKLAIWSVDSPSMVASANGDGLVTATGLGSASVSARYLSRTTSVVVQVTLRFTPVPSGVTGYLWGIWGSSASDLWAVGDAGTILRGNGTTWTKVTSPTTQPLYGVWGTSSTNVWAVGAASTILRWDGTSWKTVAAPTVPGVLLSIWGSGANDVWTAGNGTFLRWNGTAWATVTAPRSGRQITSIWGSSGTDVYAATAPASLFQWNGTLWREISLGASGNLWGVSGSSFNDVWVVGDHNILHWENPYWRSFSISGAYPQAVNVRVNSSSDAWITEANGDIAHWDGRSWMLADSPSKQNLLGVWSNGTTTWVTGWNGTLMRYP